MKSGLTRERNEDFFFNKFRQFSLKNQFYGNYCLIYKHQFQLHHHDTWAWWEKMTNYSAGHSILLKGNPPKNVSTSGHKHLSEKLHIWKNVKIHLDNFFFKQPLLHQPKRNIPESCSKVAFCFLEPSMINLSILHPLSGEYWQANPSIVNSFNWQPFGTN